MSRLTSVALRTTLCNESTLNPLHGQLAFQLLFNTRHMPDDSNGAAVTADGDDDDKQNMRMTVLWPVLHAPCFG